MNYPSFKQHSESDCGPTCLAMIAKYYGVNISINKIRDICKTNEGGTSLLALSQAANQLGFSAVPAEAKFKDLSRIPLPVVAHMMIPKENKSLLMHYVVVYKAKKNKILIADPDTGKSSYWPKQKFVKCWLTKAILFIQPQVKLAKISEDLSLFERINGLIKFQYGSIIKALFCSIISFVLGLSLSFYIQYLIDSVFLNQDRRNLNLISLCVCLAIILQFSFQWLKSYFLIHVNQRLALSLMLQFYVHVILLKISSFSARKTGEFLARFGEIGKITQACSNLLVTSLTDILTIIVCFTLMMLYNVNLALLSIVLIIFCFAFSFALKSPLKRASLDTMQEGEKLQSYLVESLTKLVTLKSFNAEKSSLHKIKNILVSTLKKSFHLRQLSLFSTTGGNFITTIFILFNLWYGATQVLESNLTAGQLMLFYALLGYMIAPIKRLIDLNQALQDALAAADRFTDILQLPTENPKDLDKETKINVAAEDFAKDLAVSKVDFEYQPGLTVLSNINFQINAKEKFAIVGQCGSGKSTFAKLLLGQYEATKGNITIGDYDLRDISPKSIRNNISLVSQQIEVFEDTIAANIAIGKDRIDMQKVIDAAKKSNASFFIEQLPDRYGTIIGKKGFGLSGGQKQSLAIARAIYNDPQVLVLDEPTANLDSKTEAEFNRVVKEFLQNKTVIIISHKISSIVDADQIAVLRKGQMEGIGTHEELLKSCKYYKELFWRSKGMNTLEISQKLEKQKQKEILKYALLVQKKYPHISLGELEDIVFGKFQIEERSEMIVRKHLTNLHKKKKMF